MNNEARNRIITKIGNTSLTTDVNPVNTLEIETAVGTEIVASTITSATLTASTKL